MTRFFASPPDISEGVIRMSDEDSAHIRSLRIRPSELFIVCDGDGTDYICRLGKRSEATPGAASAEIVESFPTHGEPSVACSAYIALAKGDRLEFAVQKTVELGVYEIILFRSERCIATADNIAKKAARLQRVALEAAKQCGRGRVPEIIAAGSFSEAIEQAARAEIPLFFYECEKERRLKQAIASCGDASTVSIVTGPEGGFAESEASIARSAGMSAVTLGPRVLRCETAPVAAIAAIMYHTGNI